MKRSVIIGAAFVLLGAGCIPGFDLNKAVTDVNPFRTESVSRARRLEVTRGMTFADGLTLTIRPTFLGVTGTVADVFGDEDGRTEARLDLSDGSALVWSRTDRRETQASKDARAAHDAEGREGEPPARAYETVTTEGRLAFSRSEDDRKMLLPAFLQEGDSSAEDNGILWLPEDAHARLKQGQKIEWSLGLGNPVLDAASGILKGFNDALDGVFGEDGDETPSPFALRSVTEDGLFAVRIDGKVETVEVIQAESAFADYLILDNPENPLILKVAIHPVAAEALNAFAPLGVDTKALGYEVTEIRHVAD